MKINFNMKKLIFLPFILLLISCGGGSNPSNTDSSSHVQTNARYLASLMMTDSSCKTKSEPKIYWLDDKNLSLSTKIYTSELGNEVPPPNFWTDGITCVSSDGQGNIRK